MAQNMDNIELFKKLEPLNYVVQRNWQNLPHGYVQGHEDIDLFCSLEDLEAVKDIIKDRQDIDVRCPLDMYYPDYINDILLENRQKWNGIWIPNNKAYFLSLYYHNAVHKNYDPYKEELKRIFLELYPPVKCTDNGVGYYV